MVIKSKYYDESSCEGIDEPLSPSKGLHKLKHEETNSMYDTDIRNAELLIDKHSVDPFGVMRIQEYDCVPMPKELDDVVIRVEVSTLFYTF
jgi:hypothetical protein